MLSIARVFLQLILIFPTDPDGAEHLFLQYMECALALKEVDKNLVFVCLTWSTTYRDDHSTVPGEKVNH